MRHLPNIALMALLTACAPAGSEPTCFALVPYSHAMQVQAAEQLAALPAGSVLARMIDNYGDLRARIRGACGR
jgi:ABC-type proline/glycine betaine transport system permease subunit